MESSSTSSNDKLLDLEALFEEDEFISVTDNTTSSQETDAKKDIDNCPSKEELASMKAEYERLQKEMFLLQEKMKLNSTNTGTSTTVAPSSENDSNSTQKRSFCVAFAAKNVEEPSQVKNNQVCNKKVGNREIEIALTETASTKSFYPNQKKTRLSHSADSSVSKTRTEYRTSQARVRNGILPSNNSKKLTAAVRPASYEQELFSRLRLKDRYIDAAELNQKMKEKLFLKLSLIRPTMKITDEKDWVTIAVVSKQMDPQTAKNGKLFSIWHLSDLDDCTKYVAFFLFGKVHEELWKNMTVGTVIGLLNPSIMPPKKENGTGNKFDDSPALTVDVAERVMKIGVSADLGWCMATKFRNKQPAGKCLAVINKQHGDVCVYHMRSKYKKMSSKRGELQSNAGTGLPTKYKQTLWNNVKSDQFFYGGQTFSAAPPTAHQNLPKKESKTKLSDILSTAKTTSESEKAGEAERSKMMEAISGIKKQTITGCSDKFAEMLASGDMVAGSRQFLNHLQKKKLSKESDSNLSAGQLLKQQKELRESNDKIDKTSISSVPAATFLQEQMKTVKKKKTLSIDSQHIGLAQDKPSTKSQNPSELLKQMKDKRFKKRNTLASSEENIPSSAPRLSLPQLGGSSGVHVDLLGDWLSSRARTVVSQSGNVPSLAELRKRKAIAKLRETSGHVELKPGDPNMPVAGFANKSVIGKIKQRVEENRKDLQQDKENEKEKITQAVFRQGNLSTDDFNKILNATSSHTHEIDVEEMERQETYFNPLIKKEMIEQKMAETYEILTKVVTCQQCNYTFWAPHDRCNEMSHKLMWKKVKKKFFECTKCKQRTITWHPYPLKPCRDCGSEKLWKRTAMYKAKDVKLDSETLLLRGIEHSRFLNTLHGGHW